MSARHLLTSVLILSLLAACGRVPSTATVSGLPEPTATATLPVATPYVTPLVLRVWVPPRFDPAFDSLLQTRLDAFCANHAGLKIEVRVKVEDSLLETLNLTFAAAPAALPDLIALPRTDLESAAALGLIQPLNASALDDTAWNPSARALGRVSDSVYGLPFALDALGLASLALKPIITWQEVADAGSLAFNTQDAYFPLALYLSAGGALSDAQGHPTLEEAVLTRVLSLIMQGQVSPFDSDEEVRLSLVQGDGIAVSWASVLMSSQQFDIHLDALPGLGDSPATLVTSWNWSVTGQDLERQKLAIELAGWLTTVEFLGKWTETVGFLPSHVDARWEQLLGSARTIPPAELWVVLAPVLRDAIASVLDGVPPDAAAHNAVERLK